MDWTPYKTTTGSFDKEKWANAVLQVLNELRLPDVNKDGVPADIEDLLQYDPRLHESGVEQLLHNAVPGSYTGTYASSGNISGVV